MPWRALHIWHARLMHAGPVCLQRYLEPAPWAGGSTGGPPPAKNAAAGNHSRFTARATLHMRIPLSILSALLAGLLCDCCAPAKAEQRLPNRRVRACAPPIACADQYFSPRVHRAATLDTKTCSVKRFIGPGQPLLLLPLPLLPRGAAGGRRVLAAALWRWRRRSNSKTEAAPHATCAPLIWLSESCQHPNETQKPRNDRQLAPARTAHCHWAAATCGCPTAAAVPGR